MSPETNQKPVLSEPTGPTFEGIDNFRDFGGVPARGGRRVRPGRLFRSGHHGRASPTDLERLDGLGLGLLVDLRRPEERLLQPSRRSALFAGVVLEDDNPDPAPDGFINYLRTAELSEASMRAFLREYYRKAPLEPRIIAIFQRSFERIAATDGAVLIHCAAGKDRTGLLAALLHHLLGVPFEDALKDYLRTNDPERIERRLPEFAEHIEAVTGRRADPETLRTALQVEAEYLEIAFETIARRHGSLDAYLEEELKVGPELRTALERACLE